MTNSRGPPVSRVMGPRDKIMTVESVCMALRMK